MTKIFCTYAAKSNAEGKLPDEPANHGRIWSPAMMSDLRTNFEDGMSLLEMCKLHGRTPDSIVAKLGAMNLVTYDPCSGNYLYNNFFEPKPKPQLEKPEMTQPLQNLTLVFGNDIKTMSESQLIKAIQTCQNEMTSFNSIPRNKWTEKRTEELKAAIDAAVAELDTRA